MILATKCVMPKRLSAIAILSGALALAVCSSGSNAPSASAQDATALAKANAEAQSRKSLELYEQTRASGSLDIAAQVGAETVAKYPGSAAAAKIKETLAEVTAKAKEDSEKRRLAGLWAYTVVSVRGGTQYAASIENNPPLSLPGLVGKDAKHAHLILRQHPEWGQTVYLMLDNEKFNCKAGCKNLPVSFDGEPAKPWKATIPPTGEPALFIDDEEAFFARVLKAKNVAIDVALVENGKRTLVFETGGLDTSHLPNTTKRK